MYQISQTHQGELESKGSRFLSFLAPYSQFNHLLYSLKNQHSKAVHFVYATRFYQIQVLESFSDDGEPKGSSGFPTLNVLRGENLINVGLISVRYFGGTLLGVGGLVRAYTKAAQNAIEKAKTSDDLRLFEPKNCWSTSIAYSNLRQIEYFCKIHEITIVKKEFQAQEILITFEATREKQKKFGSFVFENHLVAGGGFEPPTFGL